MDRRGWFETGDKVLITPRGDERLCALDLPTCEYTWGAVPMSQLYLLIV